MTQVTHQPAKLFHEDEAAKRRRSMYFLPPSLCLPSLPVAFGFLLARGGNPSVDRCLSMLGGMTLNRVLDD